MHPQHIQKERETATNRQRLDRILSTLVGNSKKESHGLKFLRFRRAPVGTSGWNFWVRLLVSWDVLSLWKTAVKTELWTWWRFQLGSVQHRQRDSVETSSARRRHTDGVVRHPQWTAEEHSPLLGPRDAQQQAKSRNLGEPCSQRRFPQHRQILAGLRHAEQ